MSITPASNQEQTTDPNTIAQRIRQAILDGNFSPNQRMVEADLCEEFHASRGAVRAALLDLTNQGLIERIQNRGARVRSVSLPEAIEITEIRMVVEGLCAAKAAENITEDEIVELKQLREGMITSVDAGNVFGYSDLHQLLHRRIREISGQLGMICIFQSTDAKTLREHATRAGIPADEIIPIGETIVLQDDPLPGA